MSRENTPEHRDTAAGPESADSAAQEEGSSKPGKRPAMPPEIGGPKGPEPTRYGDWEQNGRCTDF